MKLKKKLSKNVFSEGLSSYQLHPYIKEDFSDEKVVDELDDNVSEIEVPHGDFVGASAMLIDAINGEWDTIVEYNSIVATLREMGDEKSDQIISVIQDIVNEEHVHVGQLQKALELISNGTSYIQKGEDEAEEQFSEPIDGSEYEESLTEATNEITVGQDESDEEVKKKKSRKIK